KAKEDEAAEKEAARTPPDPAKLPGTWLIDYDGTVAQMVPDLPADVGGEIAEKLKKEMGLVSYTFGPGDAIESRMEPTGKPPRVEKGTYRLEGKKLFIRSEGSKKE